jgi:hypothetical protein
MVVTLEDGVDLIYDRLDTFTWTTNYTAKPQLFRQRTKGLSRSVPAQTPDTGAIHISEISMSRKRSDAFYNTEDVTYVISCKIESRSTTVTERIYSGMEAARRKYRKEPTPAAGSAFHIWEFLRQSKLMEYTQSVVRIIDYELTIFKQDVTTED